MVGNVTKSLAEGFMADLKTTPYIAIGLLALTLFVTLSLKPSVEQTAAATKSMPRLEAEITQVRLVVLQNAVITTEGREFQLNQAIARMPQQSQGYQAVHDELLHVRAQRDDAQKELDRFRGRREPVAPP